MLSCRPVCCLSQAVANLETFRHSNPLSSPENVLPYCGLLQAAVAGDYPGDTDEVAKRDAFTTSVLAPVMSAMEQHKDNSEICQKLLETLLEFITPSSRKTLLENKSQLIVVKVGKRHPKISQFAVNVLSALGLQDEASSLQC
jgi:hypothetical protein